MQDAEQRASQRAVWVLLLSLGIAFGSAALTSEGASIVLYVVLGIVIIAIAVARLYRRPLEWLHRSGGRRLAGVLAVLFPLGTALTFTLYPLAVAFVASAGADVRTRFAIVAVISGVGVMTAVTVAVRGSVALAPPV